MITKTIFTIWAGGHKMMPEKNISVFKDWLKLNPHFQGVIYVDKATTPSESLEEFERKINEDDSKIELRDISEAGVSDEFVRYELDRITPNYGRSSDIIRYNALYQHGGFYMDSDVQAGVIPESLFEQTDPLFCVDDCAQGSNGIGNDAFLCSAQHPIMKSIMDYAHSNYRRLHETYKDYAYPGFGPTHNPYDLDFSQQVMESSRTEWIQRTIAITGSGALHPALYDHDVIIKKNSIHPEYSLSSRGILKKIKGNDLNWGNPRLRDFNSTDKAILLEEAIMRSIDSIVFEANNMGLMRLDYHIQMILCAIGTPGFTLNHATKGEPTIDESRIAEMLIERLAKSNINYSNVHNLAWMSRHSLVRAFYQEHLSSYFSHECEDLNRHTKALLDLLDETKDESEKIRLFNYYIQQLATNEANFHQDLQIRLNAAIKLIHSNQDLLAKREEQKLPILFFHRAFYTDGSREIISHYHELFSKAENLFEQKAILYSLLTSKGDQSIKEDMVLILRYPNRDFAIKSLFISLQYEYPNATEEEINREIATRIEAISGRPLPEKTEPKSEEEHLASRHGFFNTAAENDNIEDESDSDEEKEKENKNPLLPY